MSYLSRADSGHCAIWSSFVFFQRYGSGLHGGIIYRGNLSVAAGSSSGSGRVIDNSCIMPSSYTTRPRGALNVTAKQMHASHCQLVFRFLCLKCTRWVETITFCGTGEVAGAFLGSHGTVIEYF